MKIPKPHSKLPHCLIHCLEKMIACLATPLTMSQKYCEEPTWSQHQSSVQYKLGGVLIIHRRSRYGST